MTIKSDRFKEYGRRNPVTVQNVQDINQSHPMGGIGEQQDRFHVIDGMNDYLRRFTC